MVHSGQPSSQDATIDSLHALQPDEGGDSKPSTTTQGGDSKSSTTTEGGDSESRGRGSLALLTDWLTYVPLCVCVCVCWGGAGRGGVERDVCRR